MDNLRDFENVIHIERWSLYRGSIKQRRFGTMQSGVIREGGPIMECGHLGGFTVYVSILYNLRYKIYV